jgi:hypothetical protein
MSEQHERTGGSAGLPVRAPVTLADLTGHLLWPKLLRSGRLALAPGRVGMCVVMLAVVFGMDRVWMAVFGLRNGPLAELLDRAWAGLGGVWRGAFALDATGVARGLVNLFLFVPRRVVDGPGVAWWQAVIYVVVVAPLTLLVYSVVAGAVSRSVVCEFAVGRRLTWAEALGFSVARWKAMLGVVAGPLVAVWGLGLLLTGLGWLLLRFAGVNVVGAVVFPVFLLLSAAATVLMVGYVLAAPMLTAGVAGDNADAGDALQRVYAVVVGKPTRTLIYWGVAVAHAVVAATLVFVVIQGALEVANATAGTRAVLTVRETGPGFGEPNTAGAVVGFWIKVALLIGAGYVVSVFVTAGSVMYLLLRRVHDGQDVAEVWMPAEQGGAGGAG